MTSLNLKQISRILVQFCPKDTSAREFLARIVCQQGTNPECKIERKIMVRGEPLIEIEYDNKEVVRLDPGEMTVNDIVKLVKNRADEMDMSAQLKAAGLANHVFSSDHVALRAKGGFAGAKHKIPRQ